jgi:hypothetical protein
VKVEVRSRTPGVVEDNTPTVLVELAEERTTVRELIRRAVEEQIHELRADASRCRRMLDRQYLSQAEIEAQAATGAVRMPIAHTAPDVDTEVARAHQAYAGKVFLIFAGGRQAGDLDEDIVLRLGEPVVFLRLTALVGG